MGYHADPADFIQPQRDPDSGEAPVAAWRWNSLPSLELGAVAPNGRRWEAARYRHYNAYLARQPLGETMTRAVASSTTSPQHCRQGSMWCMTARACDPACTVAGTGRVRSGQAFSTVKPLRSVRALRHCICPRGTVRGTA